MSNCDHGLLVQEQLQLAYNTKLCKVPLSHSCHSYLRLELWVQDDPQIVQKDLSETVQTHPEQNILTPQNQGFLNPLMRVEPVVLPSTPPRHWDRTSMASLQWTRMFVCLYNLEIDWFLANLESLQLNIFFKKKTHALPWIMEDLPSF